MLNIYCGVISKENEWQDIAGINNIGNVDQKQSGPENKTLGHDNVIFKKGNG